MKKRIIAIALALTMLLSIPVSAAAADKKDFVDAGSLSYGSIILDSQGARLELDYVYSDGMALNESVTKTLTTELSAAGFPSMTYKADSQMKSGQRFFTVKCDDKAALSDMIDLIESAAVPAQVTSATDAAVSVSATDVSGSDAADTPSGTSADAEPVAATTADTTSAQCSLRALLDGPLWLSADGSLRECVAAAFPEFDISAPTATRIPDGVSSSDIAYNEDKTGVIVDILPPPTYVDHVIGGQTVQALMVSTIAYRFEVDRCTVAGTVKKELATTTTTTAATTTTTAATTATATTTTALTTASTTTTAITTTTTAAPIAPNGDGQAAYVNTRFKRLRLRSGPGFTHSVVRMLPKGTPVTVTSTSNKTWFKVRLEDGTEGYCYSYYIAFKENDKG